MNWNNFIPFHYSGTIVLAAVLGLVLPIAGNRIYDKEKASLQAAAERGGLIERLMADSIEYGKLIELSLKKQKIIYWLCP